MADGQKTQGWAVCQTITTDDGADHELMLYPLADNHSVMVRVVVVGQRYDAGAGAEADIFSYTGDFLYNRSGAAAVLHASGTPEQLDPAGTGWRVTVDANGANVRIQVMGTAAEDVRWIGRCEIVQIEQTIA